MGLSLPASGSVYLDANCIIYSVEKIEPYAALLQPIWRAAGRGNFSLIGSELLIPETLVKPMQRGDSVLEATFRSLLFHSREFRLLPITTGILEDAARLRATIGLKTPDAIHVATAIEAGCGLFVTNDLGLRRVIGLPMILLSEVRT